MTTDWAWLEPLILAAEAVEYRDWAFVVGVDQDLVPNLQIQFFDPADGSIQKCRKWLLYKTMNTSELLRTIWMAVLAAEEHESRERFRYKGVRIMTPHVDFERLAATGLPVATTADPR